MEVLVIPRKEEYDLALHHTSSKTLADLSNLTTWEIVRQQALHAPRIAEVWQATIERHYPIRVRLASGATRLRFRVEGGALGYTPIIIGGLSSSDAGMLWISDEDGGYSSWPRREW